MTKQITTKDPKAVERGKKGWETQLEKIKAKHLEEIKNGGNNTGNDTGSGTGSDTGNTGNDTGNATSILPQVNHYYVGGVVILVAGIAMFFWNNQHSEKSKILPAPPVPKKTKSNFRWGMN